ncbi:MAG: RdgB/HAM1 family non-canonical purine NTP pyrophosphatase [Defluviitaleaceae bacterium]|nr:RdgB/HAM1 family non-canonical purine NTP pyrophosphatase [Defluviitaleaceae bacterium]
MKKLIVATRNKGKVAEIKAFLEGVAHDRRPFSDVLSLDDIGLCLDLDAVEDGATFEENAAKKAVAVREAMKSDEYAVLADDSGLEIDALGGEPGVDSANYMGRETPYPTRFDAILAQMPAAGRSARFVCVMALALEGEIHIFRREMEGEIAHKSAGESGFGYDPIFYVPQYNKTAAELTMEQKNAISHRGRALKALMEWVFN